MLPIIRLPFGKAGCGFWCSLPGRKIQTCKLQQVMDFAFRSPNWWIWQELQLDVSNFSVSMLEKWMETSTAKGYAKPSVYKGKYNLFCRGLETSLFSTLRKYGVSFVAFKQASPFPPTFVEWTNRFHFHSPLAGGFLTGKLTRSNPTQDLKSARFEILDGNPLGKAFRHWYYKVSMHQPLKSLESFAMATASRWSRLPFPGLF